MDTEVEKKLNKSSKVLYKVISIKEHLEKCRHFLEIKMALEKYCNMFQNTVSGIDLCLDNFI